MAATARREIDTGEEDIAAIAKQISDHAEAIYQTWKARGLSPTEILTCRPSPGLKIGDGLRGKAAAMTPNGDGGGGNVETSLPPDLVPQQRPEAPRRPAGLAVRLEVAREEERLMRALRTGSVLAERAADRPDVVPPLSLVDYAKSRYQDRLEGPARRGDRERRSSLGAQVSEARTKFEARARRASSAGAAPAAAAAGGACGGSATSDASTPAPVRPFLTRGSVAERVMMFEKCPSEATLELAKRKTPAATTWRGPNDVINKAQNYPGSKQPSKSSSAPAHTTLQRSVRSATAGGGAAARTIPRFHFPKGRPPPSHQAEHALHKVQSAFSTFPNSQVPRESFKHIVKACECPLYWKMPLFLATQSNLHASVDGHKFIDFWKKMTSQCHDAASRFVYAVTRGASSTLAPEDFVPLVQDVVDTHPGLSFLKEATEFHSRYVHTVIARIFYCVNRSWSGRISIAELRRSDLLQVIQLLEDEEDINQVTAYFSYEHFYVIYCKFWELDRDHDLFIDRHDLARHNDHALSSRMIDRVLSGCVSRGNQNRATPDGEPRMSYTEFVWFLLAEEDKTHPTAVEYWFRCMDLDGDGFLSMYELEYFYEEQMHRMEAIGIETLPFVDCLCQMLDMVHPATDGKIRLSDLKRCKMTPVFYDTFFNLEKYLDHEQRDPFASQRDGDAEMSEWERFAAEEYELLVAEEGGSDAHDHISYDETDEDCVSPNGEEMAADTVDDSSIDDSSVSEGPAPTPVAPAAPTYVTLDSICSGERRAGAAVANGFAERRLPSKPAPPDKPVSLTMLNGAADGRYAAFGNASFLYSQPQRAPPSYTAALTDLGKGRLDPPASPTSPPHRISDKYERAVAERDAARPRPARAALFGQLGRPAAGAAPAGAARRDRDDDDDYARDSDECSI